VDKRMKCVECRLCDPKHNYHCLVAYEQYRYYMSVYKHLNCEHFEPRDNVESPTTATNSRRNAITRDCNVEMVGSGDVDILGDDYDIGCK
jgi:hypothetical protein